MLIGQQTENGTVMQGPTGSFEVAYISRAAPDFVVSAKIAYEESVPKKTSDAITADLVKIVGSVKPAFGNELGNDRAPAFAQFESLKSLPLSIQENVDKEYEAGHNSYGGRAKLQSELRKQKGIGLIEGNDKLGVLAFPEVVIVADAGNSPAASLCDIIQYRQSDGGVRIISPSDIGRCVSYYRFKPMVMDLNGDGYQDLIFFPIFEQPQVGGEYDTVQALLYDPKNRFLCASQLAARLIGRGTYATPKKLHDHVISLLREKKMTLECDEE